MFDIDYLSYATQSRALSVKYWAVNELISLLHIYGGSQRKFGVHANRTSHCKKMIRSFPWTIG